MHVTEVAAIRGPIHPPNKNTSKKKKSNHFNTEISHLTSQKKHARVNKPGEEVNNVGRVLKWSVSLHRVDI